VHLEHDEKKWQNKMVVLGDSPEDPPPTIARNERVRKTKAVIQEFQALAHHVTLGTQVKACV
jgi:hypothetical protein